MLKSKKNKIYNQFNNNKVKLIKIILFNNQFRIYKIKILKNLLIYFPKIKLILNFLYQKLIIIIKMFI